MVLKYGQKHFIDKQFKDDNALDMFLHRIHPKQIIMRLDDKPFMFYEVEYGYTTERDNKRKGVKYFIFNTYSPQIDMRSELEKWIEEFNKENPNRQLLNVKFLRSKCLGYTVLK